LTGNDCSTQILCLNGCSSQGVCLSDAKCSCFPGYSGVSCEIMILCPNNCTSEENGICQKDGTCLCRDQYKSQSCNETININDLNKTNNNLTDKNFNFDDNNIDNDKKTPKIEKEARVPNHTGLPTPSMDSQNSSIIRETSKMINSHPFPSDITKNDIKIINNSIKENIKNISNNDSVAINDKSLTTKSNISISSHEIPNNSNVSKTATEILKVDSKYQPLKIINMSQSPVVFDNLTEKEPVKKENSSNEQNSTNIINSSEINKNSNLPNNTSKKNIFGMVSDNEIDPNRSLSLNSKTKYQSIHECPNSCSFNGYCINKTCFCREGYSFFILGL
jgi:hypothetical protein